MGRVVLIDADEAFCASLLPLIAAHRVDAAAFNDGVRYLKSPIFEQPHVAVIALGQAAFNGLDLLRLSIERSAATHAFAAVEELDLKEIVAATRMGATDVLQRPFSIDPIVRCALGQGDWQLAGLPNSLGAAGEKLSPREQEVLRCILRGEETAAIAETLRVSVRTVESHQARIYAKCGVKSRAALIHKFKT